MPKQDFNPLDYTGPIVVGAIFCVTLFLISFFVINFFCITKYDDITKFELMGGKYGWRLGPHPLVIVKKGGFVAEEDVDDAESV
ncbi:hypothetical protein GCK72_023216 [Caenorhabditis remanei]|uniref:Uncharacterized protein n=3 Tax=Caenorhabditis TaxID=6237 RepID=E3MAN6_CAERE|nr:hypothetical protein GCK72_023216 [Caenorhabditis remanei]EFO97401.1 hypothetical protein CRE_16606 [Caenorhabditis remanei]KAF1746759.1 hypothetical protein GCK72_023216 [Caenorhabditis remanei]